jgi:cyanophycinase
MIVPKGKLIIIGGAVDMGSNVTIQEHILQPDYIKFFEQGILKRIITESAKHHGSLVEVITTASQIPELVGEEYIKAFGQLNVTHVNVLHIKSREDAAKKEYLDRIRKADVVMFSGGDQLRLTAIFGGTEFLQILKKRYLHENFVIAGTSAGAAAASTHMIYRGQSNEALIKGEDAGLLITEGNIMEAIGSGLIILVDGRNIVATNIYDVEIGSPVSIENLKVHVMSIYDKYDLAQHRLLIKKTVKVEEGVFIHAPDSDLLQ